VDLVGTKGILLLPASLRPHDKAGFTDNLNTVSGTNGFEPSPPIPSSNSLFYPSQKSASFDAMYRYVSALPAQLVNGIRDRRRSTRVAPRTQLGISSIVGQNLLASLITPEFEEAMSIQLSESRSAYAKITGRRAER